MAWPTLVPPTAGTVITVAREVAMNNEPLTWLRLLTGNADPPAAHYVVVSTGAASTAWGKISADELSPGAAVGNLGYTPLNKAGDTTLADLTVSRQASGTATDGVLMLGQTGGAAFIGKIGSSIYLHGLPVIVDAGSLTVQAGNLAVTGDIFATRVGGTVGIIWFAGHFLGWDGSRLSFDANTVWHSGNDGSGSGLDADLWRGLAPAATTVGAASTAGNSSLLGGLAPGNGSGQIPVSNGVTNVGLWATRAENVGGRTPTGTPTANSIPVADASGTLDAWVTPTAAAPVPSGLIAFIADGSVPTGWSFYTPANGRMIVAAGTASVSNAQTFAVGNSYGGDWAHAHTVNIQHAHAISATHNHGASALGIAGATGPSSDINGLATAGGVNLNTTGHTHGVGTLDVSGTTDQATSSGTDNGGSTAAGTSGVVWIPPSHALNAIRKT